MVEAHHLYCLRFSLFGSFTTCNIQRHHHHHHHTARAAAAVAASDGQANSNADLFVGFDLGTSGARISVIQQDLKQVYTRAIPWSDNGNTTYDDPDAWMGAVETLLTGAAESLKQSQPQQQQQPVTAICVSGTSASCLLVNGNNVGKPSRMPRMYNYDILATSSSSSNKDAAADLIYAIKARDLLHEFAPDRHTARSTTGSLAKLLAWNEEKRLTKEELLCHQADYVALRLMSNDKVCGSSQNKRVVVCSDWHNCLKLGYNVRELNWPLWLLDCLAAAGISSKVLPAQVVSPGAPMGHVSPDVARRWPGFLSSSTTVVGGTTDSNAAFFAATGSQPGLGTAVTSLGSTLALKQLSKTYVEDASLGVYSHRFPSVFEQEEAWLVGGASNVGCAVLRQEGFSNQELDELSQDIDPSTDSPLHYYPLTKKKGERFPVVDSNKEAILTPVPDNRREYLHGILQGICDVERDGYLALGKLGASPKQPTRIWTCGGGSRNNMWSQIRQRRLREAFQNNDHSSNSSTDDEEDAGNNQNLVDVAKANNVEASYGAAILAAASFVTSK